MLEFILPWPPSVNTMYATFQGRRILSRKGREYHRTVAALLLRDFGKLQPLTGRLRVERLYFPPDQRRRDISNLSKAIDDALTKAGIWIDDSQIDDERSLRGLTVQSGRALVRIHTIT